MAYVRTFVKDTYAAEDTCQDACESLCRYIKKYGVPEESEILKLMYVAARWKVNDYLRKIYVQKSALEKINAECSPFVKNDLSMNEAAGAPKDDMEAILYDKIRMLRPVEQFVVLERMKGRRDDEIAAIIGRSPHAVTCMYSRIMKKLKKIMADGKNKV